MDATNSRHSVKRAPRDIDPNSDFAADEFRCRLTFVGRSANLQGLTVFFMGQAAVSPQEIFEHV